MKQCYNPFGRKKMIDILIKYALENIDEANTEWTYFAARIYLHNLYRKAAENQKLCI